VTLTKEKKITTLYAQWNFSYTVRFNACGGTGTMPDEQFN
jgi:hypothetical protein